MLRRRSSTATVDARDDRASTTVSSALRDQRDPDPLVEAMTARLRRAFPGTLATDEWGRPVSYRQVVRVALSALPASLTIDLAGRVRANPQAPDAAAAGESRVIELPSDAARADQPSGVGWPT